MIVFISIKPRSENVAYINGLNKGACVRCFKGAAKMYFRSTLGAILVIYILCANGDNGANYNEDNRIYGKLQFLD